MALTSSPGETTTVGKQHDNKSLLIKPAFDQTDVDAPQPGVFQVIALHFVSALRQHERIPAIFFADFKY